MEKSAHIHDVLVIGAGIAGLSAAIYLGRAQRDTLVIDSGKSMARWEPDAQNYLGFPDGVAGDELLSRGAEQARRYEVTIVTDEILEAEQEGDVFHLQGQRARYSANRLLIATGIFHLPPEIEGVTECLGHSMFFCKDCDGYRNQGKTILIYGWNDEAVEYALGMLLYSPVIGIALDGRRPAWDAQHDRWLREHEIPVYPQPIVRVERQECQIRALQLEDGTEVAVDAIFTTRGDVYLNRLAKALGAHVDAEGQIEVDASMASSVKGVYAAGCVTPANCQMIIAAGQGATAAQAINRDLFLESLKNRTLKHFRQHQIDTTHTEPAVNEP